MQETTKAHILMMGFKQMMAFLEDVKTKNNHPNGTYVAAKLTKASQSALDYFVTEAGITNAADPKQYHSTVIYSRKGVPDVKNYKFKLPFKAHIKEWKLFDTQFGKSGKCLVAIMDSPELEKAHRDIRQQYGALHGFPDYHPHVTVSYDYDGPLPKVIPGVALTYGSIEIKPLDPEFVPPKKDA